MTEQTLESKEILPVNIEEEMRGSYLDYSMSVIIGRALPAVRDGLKPVHRRILYAMYKEGLLASKRYSKCAGVVGEVLKKYHPHGDSAVYDSLVRMAQEWNMRYPLIDGQGNFGCFTGDTLVRLADGSSKSFEQLVQDDAKGKKHFTYTIRKGGEVAMTPIRAPRLTKKDAPIVCVEIDNGERIKCTPDHRFLLRDGTYREARDLQAEDSLMPLYSRISNGQDPNLKGYEEIYNPGDDTWIYAHRLADDYNIENEIYPRSQGRVRHHADFKKLNNDPRNIIRMPWAEHRRLHQEYLGQFWKDKNFQEKMRGILSELWKDANFRKKTVEAIKKENQRRWKDKKFVQKQLSAKKKLWGDTQFREKILKAAIECNVLLHGSAEQKEGIKQAQAEWLIKMWKDPAYISTQRERMREISGRIWANTGHREKIRKLTKTRMGTDAARSSFSQFSQNLWEDPDYRQYISTLSRLRWKDPVYRARHDEHLSSNGKKTTRSRFLTVCKRALETFGELTPVSYQAVQAQIKVKGILRFEQGYQRYYKDDFSGLIAASQSHHGRLNHRVVSVTPAGRADVYDLTVNDTHNFALAAGVFVHNSVDGDSAAAYRYTECRLTKLAEEMMADIEKDTVDFSPNFDDSVLEPRVLPTRVPNLLINGSDGIAVGMATKVPPHNLTEVTTALIELLKNPQLTVDDLMQHIPGPDFPTAGIIHGRGGIVSAYKTGRGRVVARARYHIETIGKSGDREAIIFTEIPYQVNKAKVIENIAELVGDGKIDGISDLRDESNREGMRVVVELKKNTNADVILNQLFAHTALQSTFGVIMLSIVENRPRVLNLKDTMMLFLKHRREVVIRRTAFELAEAEKRAHILEGLKVAVENIDAVIALIKAAVSPEVAKTGLMQKFKLSAIQAQAILEMRLQRLTGLERDKIIVEYKEVIALIAKLKEILSSDALIRDIIQNELTEIREKHGDKRRTEIVDAGIGEINDADLIQEEEMAVTVSHQGYVKRNPVTSYRAQRRGGKGKRGMLTRDEDFVERIFTASTHDTMLIFSSGGKVYWLRVYEIPEAGLATKGKSIASLISLGAGEKVAAIQAIKEYSDTRFVTFVTKTGTVKKTTLSAYSNPRAGGIIAISLHDDELVQVIITDGKSDILISTAQGQTIRFQEDDVRPMGRAAAGVRGITLAAGDYVVGMDAVEAGKTILTVSQRGYGKRTLEGEYRQQGRGGSGVITMKTTDKTGPVVAATQVRDSDDLILITNKGKAIRQKVAQISVIGRNTQGVRVFNVEDDEHVTSIAIVEAEDEVNGNGNGDIPPVA